MCQLAFRKEIVVEINLNSQLLKSNLIYRSIRHNYIILVGEGPAVDCCIKCAAKSERERPKLNLSYEAQRVSVGEGIEPTIEPISRRGVSTKPQRSE